MGYNDYFKHTYRVSKISIEDHEIGSEIVIGSQAAFRKQLDLEEQGFRVMVLNITKGGVEEYRTGAKDE